MPALHFFDPPPPPPPLPSQQSEWQQQGGLRQEFNAERDLEARFHPSLFVRDQGDQAEEAMAHGQPHYTGKLEPLLEQLASSLIINCNYSKLFLLLLARHRWFICDCLLIVVFCKHNQDMPLATLANWCLPGIVCRVTIDGLICIV